VNILRYMQALIIDEIPLSAQCLEANLQSIGLNQIDMVQRVGRVETLLAAAAYDLVFVSVELAACNPLEFIRWLRAHPSLKQSMLLAMGDERLTKARAATARNGVDSYFGRPIGSDHLRDKILDTLYGPAGRKCRIVPIASLAPAIRTYCNPSHVRMPSDD
jgi:DNA-binding response OmpR family regulator